MRRQKTNFLSDMEQESFSNATGSLSNYYDLVAIKQSNKYLRDFITNTAVFPKIGTLTEDGNTLTMNVEKTKYKATWWADPFGHDVGSPIRDSVAPEKIYKIETLRYVEFCFSAKKLTIRIKFNFSLRQIEVYYNEKIKIIKQDDEVKLEKNEKIKIIQNVAEVKLERYVNTLLKMNPNEKKNMLFIFFKKDSGSRDRLEFIQTNSKLQKPYCLEIK
jgi:hypothetical protein